MQKKYVITLHRYYVWANSMKKGFDQIRVMKLDKGKFWDTENGILKLMYMSIWYGMLYVVIEGWQELKLSDDKVDGLLNSPNAKLLRRYRHGAFHFQKDYFDDRFVGFWRDGIDSATWVRSLHRELGRFFLEYFDSHIGQNKIVHATYFTSSTITRIRFLPSVIRCNLLFPPS